MYDRTPQEELLVIEALVEYHSGRKDVQPERATRAWVLANEDATSRTRTAKRPAKASGSN